MSKICVCKRCGGIIRWRKLPSGKWAPENADMGYLLRDLAYLNRYPHPG